MTEQQWPHQPGWLKQPIETETVVVISGPHLSGSGGTAGVVVAKSDDDDDYDDDNNDDGTTTTTITTTRPTNKCSDAVSTQADLSVYS